MALNGSYYKYGTSTFGLYVEWTATQNVIGNYSDVTQKIYLSYTQVEVGSRSDSTSSINGTSVTYTAPAITDYTSGSKKKLLYTHTVRVNHASNGTAANIPLSASWRFGGTYAGVSIGTITASTSVTLNSIDRAAPTISLSTASVTANSVIITATSNAVADVWDYSIDNGSTWYRLSTVAGTTASATIASLSPNTTYNIKVRARRQSNQVYGTSAAKSITTLGNTLLNSVSSLKADSATPTITMNWTVYNNYTHTLVVKDGNTTVLTIEDLTCSIGTNNKTVTLTSQQKAKLLMYMSDKQEFTATFYLTTYDANIQIGNTVSKTALVRTSAGASAPTFVDFTHYDSDVNGTVAITGDDQLYIKGYSTLHIDVDDVTANSMSTLASYRITVGSDSKDFPIGVLDYGVINTAGDNVSLKVEAIDSRGYSTAVTKTIKVIDYNDVSITNYTIRRKNEIEATVQLAFSGDISPITIDDVSQNGVVSAKFRYAPNGGSWSGWNNLTVAETTQNFEFATLALSNSGGVLEFDPNSQFTIDIKVTDRLSSDTMTLVLNKGTPLVAFRSKKVGINTPDPQAALHVIGDVMVNDDTVADFVVERGVSGIWSYEKWHSGKARCWGTTATISFEFKEEWIVDTYFNSTSYNLPDGLFISPPDYVNIQTLSTDGLHSNSIYNLDKTKVQWYAMSHGAQLRTRNLKFLLLAEGKWK